MSTATLRHEAKEIERIDLRVLQRIDAIDLTEVKQWLMLPKEGDKGEGWCQARCDKTERRYKMFLKLRYLYPHLPLVPTIFIDVMWHHHVLLTRQYAKDCMQALGFFVHHQPIFDLNLDKHQAEYAVTRQLFLEVFQEKLKAECPATCCSPYIAVDC